MHKKLSIALVYLTVNNFSNVLLGAVAPAHTKVNNQSMYEMFSIAEVQTKDINCISANKSCLLQVVPTKAIAALTQFCYFLILP